MNTLCRCDRDSGAWALLFATFALLLALPASAQPDSRLAERAEIYSVDIGRVTRVQALHELGTQTGLFLGYLSTNAAEEQAIVGPVQGRYSIEGVLRELLRSSVLTFRWLEPHTIYVEPLRLAGTRNGEIVQLPATMPLSIDTLDRGPPEEIIVVGWQLRDLSFSAAPVRIIDRERIDAIGAPTLAEALKYISQSAYTRPEGFRTSGAQYAEMRGLGPDTPLILINGRRAFPSANSLTSSAFDLNTLPITAVERIEILLDAAAAVYGTDAIGGVINIVLRETVPEPVLELRYGAADGGAEQRRVTGSFGVERRGFNAAAVVDYFDLGGLLGADRRRWRDQDFRRFGGADRRSSNSSPGNISAALPGNLPGLSASFAAVPLTDLTPGVSREDFIATAGQRNLDSVLRYWSVVPEGKRLSTVATASYDFNAGIEASAEVLHVQREAAYQFSPPFISGVQVAAGNAFNPFGVPVIANQMLTDFAPQSQFVESQLLRTVLALRGRWGGWDWIVSWLRSDEQASTWVANPIDMAQVMEALGSPDRDWALNPFQHGAVYSPELLDRLRAPRHVDDLASAGTQFAGSVQGTIMQLPAGRVSTVIGGEWREETAQFNPALGEFGRDVTSAFAQIHIPLVSRGMGLTAMRELSLTAGARWDRYSDLGWVFRRQLGAIWKPHPYVTVHTSRGGSFRPPSLYELYLPPIPVPSRVTDPARGNEQANVLVTVGGNRDLDATSAESLTAGITFSPEGPQHWKVSADYWRIDMDRRVASLPAALMLANEVQFAGRIVRAQPTPADVVAGRPGALQFVDGSRINAGGVKASGVDFSITADFATGGGVLTPELLTTWFDEYLSVDVPGAPAVDRVALASELGTIGEWRAIFSLSWQRGPLDLEAFARHTPAYDDAIAGVRIGRKISSQTLFDLQGSFDFGALPGASRWRDMKFTVGAVNLFDQEPRFAEIGDGSGFDLSQGDLKQRSYYLRLDKAF